MRILGTGRGTLALVAALCVVLVASLSNAAARGGKIVWGSSLRATPRKLIQGDFAADAQFWNVSLGGGHAAGVRHTTTAPRNGTISAIKLRTGNDSVAVPIRISVIRRTSGGSFRVVTTSNPHFMLPAHSPGIHTFSTSHLQFRMPLKKGDLVALDTPGVRTGAMVWYGAVASSVTDSFTGHGPTQNQGFTWTGTRHNGVELLLQIVEQPG